MATPQPQHLSLAGAPARSNRAHPAPLARARCALRLQDIGSSLGFASLRAFGLLITRRLVGATLALIHLSSPAFAQDSSPNSNVEEMEIRGRRFRETSLGPRADHSIRFEDRAPRFETLGDVMSELPGVALFRRGGAGASQVLSIRGADFDHTLILIDDIPIAGPDRGAVDLGLLPIDGFGRVEIFRGSAPIRYGAGTIGGVVRLVPKEAQSRRLKVQALAASFDTYQARAEGEAWLDSFSVVAAGGALHADNDFRFIDDNATLSDPTDDEEATRENAHVDRGNGIFVLSWEEGPHRLAALGMFVQQERGLPGPATVASLDSDQRRTRLFGSLGYKYRGEIGSQPFEFFLTGGIGSDRDQVRDPFGRIGTGREDTNDHYLNLDVRTGAFLDLFSWWTLGATVFYRYDDIQLFNVYATPGDQPSSRDLLTMAGESLFQAELAKIEFSLRASVSAQLTWARLTESRLQDTLVNRFDQVGSTYRFEASVRPWSFLTLSGKYTSGIQLPTTLELFGNRDTVVGNTSLTPENSTSLDAGVILRQEWGVFSVHADARYFLLQVDDIIIPRRTSRNTIAFRNERSGEVSGLEGFLNILVRPYVQTTASITWMDSSFDNRGFDRDQPLRVPFRVFGRLIGKLPLKGWMNEVSAYGEIDHRSGFFTDSANLVEQQPYTSLNVGIGSAFLDDRITLAAFVRNLNGELGQDLLAFPRPGRFFGMTLQWQQSF